MGPGEPSVGLKAIGAGLAMVGAFGPGIVIGMVVNGAIAIYALVVALIILFVL